ncbi:MAG: serine/threonine-protein kinase [Kofleriaceae bacterium]
MSDDANTRPLPKLDLLETIPAHARRDSEADVDDILVFGGRLGRYLILDRVGRGGMGIVYAAYDPVLDRRIAVKLLRGSLEDDASSGRARMEREAQALARLSHANVIIVHDVGEHDGQMYIAMELVDGTTLREWVKQRPWREVLTAYLGAACGLGAAHGAGLVHRDFKPDNVLVGNDGAVRVTDFGLARRAGDVAELSQPVSPISSPSAFSSDLTAAGTVMGTLAYMAPEQIEGKQVDERSDQCSWCIATWEAIYGEQPFVSGNLEARSTAMKSVTPKPPAKPVLPRAVVRALQRGMLPDASARWPSMAALVDAIERGLASRRWLVTAVALAGVAIIAGVFAIGQSSGERRATECTKPPSDGVWTPSTRAEVDKAFSATGAPFALDASAEVARSVESWRTRWQGVAIESCRATHVQHTQSEQTLDLRGACLDRKRDELAATIVGLARADRKVVESAATLTLPDLDACSDVAALAGALPPPRDATGLAALEAPWRAIEEELAGGLTLDRAKQLLAATEAPLASAIKLGWPPLIARAQRDIAEIDVELGHGKEARSALLAAAAAASAGNDHDLLVDLYVELSNVEAKLTSNFELGTSWVGLAGGTLSRLGSRPQKHYAVARATGYVAERSGRAQDARAAYTTALGLAVPLGGSTELRALIDVGRAESTLNETAAARKHLERARELATKELGARHPLVGSIDHDLGTVAFREGAYGDALATFEAALAIRTAAYGAESIEAANTIEAMGNTEVMLDHGDQAKADFQKAIDLFTARLGPDHPDVLNAYNDIGGTYHRAGDYALAFANSQKVLAIRERVLGPDHPDVAESLVNSAVEAKNLEKWDVVNANYPRALAIYEKQYGSSSIEVAILMINLGEARRAQHDLDGAQQAYERAKTTIAKNLGEDHPMLAHVWNGLGQVELARGHADAAISLLERAIAIREKSPSDATDLAESRFALARALPASDAARAKQLATAARDDYKVAGPGYAKRLAAVDAWLK